MKAHKYVYFILLSVGTIIADRLTKLWIVRLLPVPGQEIHVLGTALSFTHVHNTGGAFGLFSNFNFLFVIVGILVPVLILIFFRKLLGKGVGWSIGTGLILGGAVGNLIDRLLYGHVIDFIDVHFWPIFNVADIGITVGIGILFLLILREGNEEKKEESAQGPEGDT